MHTYKVVTSSGIAHVHNVLEDPQIIDEFLVFTRLGAPDVKFLVVNVISFGVTQ